MSLVKYYICDICNKKFKKVDLYRFKRIGRRMRKIKFILQGYRTKNICNPSQSIEDIVRFDICGKCLSDIRFNNRGK